MKSRTLFSMTIFGLSLTLAAFAVGQENPWEIDGDVDGDGLVGTTDIQHVINGALGIRDRGPEAVRQFLRQYVVASPRAALAPVPQLQTDDPQEIAHRCTVAGATYNFPRDNGRLLVRAGGVVVFRYDRNAEAVIYPGACGGLRSELTVETRPVRPIADGETDDDSDAPDREGEGDDEIPEPEPEWTFVGRDAVEGRDCGPLFGTGLVAVRHRFERAGDYLVRATIRTFAVPAQEVDDAATDPCGASRSVDEVFIGVRVVPPDVQVDDLDWEAEGRANAVPELFGRHLDQRLDTEISLP